jgi:IS66 C-terminal element
VWTSSRRNFFVKTVFPAASAPWATKMGLAMSNPTGVISPMDGLFAMAESLSAFGTLRAEAIHPIKLNDVEPQAYIAGVLDRLVNLWPASRTDELMPWAWPKASAPNRLAA